MRLLVSGDRHWDDAELIGQWLDVLKPTLVIQGEAPGADRQARQQAELRGIPVSGKPADWDKHGVAAGPIRNREMLKELPECVLAFHDNIASSKGTADMVKASLKAGLRVILVSHRGVKVYAARPQGFFQAIQ